MQERKDKLRSSKSFPPFSKLISRCKCSTQIEEAIRAVKGEPKAIQEERQHVYIYVVSDSEDEKALEKSGV